ncbi:MAG: low molecular weight phosphotyrosine protein phosphatase [Leptospirales bacterium]|nr:low molecular weight phosphotyrosine protein phosphatase [Leptospirales bacterium]
MRSQAIGALFVCLGNICRSPAAEAAFRFAVRQRGWQSRFRIDSCGTSGYHDGEAAHSVTRRVGKEFGLQVDSISRRLQARDFAEFDYLLAMDSSNYQELCRRAPDDAARQKVLMFRRFDPQWSGHGNPPDVPDPYYGGREGFVEVQQIALRSSEALLDWLAETHQL